jgi:hypothetical protein
VRAEARPSDPSSRATLTRFVVHTLDEAATSWPPPTSPDGIALHAKEHPEDAGRVVDGVVANQCQTAA